MKLSAEHYALGAFLLLIIASLWETRTLPPAIIFLIVAAVPAKAKRDRPK